MDEQSTTSEKTFTVAVRFAHDAHLMLIPDVSEYGFYTNSGTVAYVQKNGHELYFPLTNLLYIGRADELGDLPLQKEENGDESR